MNTGQYDAQGLGGLQNRQLAQTDAMPAVPAALDRQQVANKLLHQAVNELEGRLGMILRIENSPPNDRKDVPRPEARQLHERMQEQANATSDATARLQNILRLLEI